MYVLHKAGNIVKHDGFTKTHVGWFLEDKRILTTAPWQDDQGRFGFSLTHLYPTVRIGYSVATQDGKERMFKELERMVAENVD